MGARRRSAQARSSVSQSGRYSARRVAAARIGTHRTPRPGPGPGAHRRAVGPDVARVDRRAVRGHAPLAVARARRAPRRQRSSIARRRRRQHHLGVPRVAAHQGARRRPRGRTDAAADTGDDPWSVDRLVWSVLDALLRNASDPLIAPLLDLPSGSSRFGRARRVADLFDRYHVHRPAMICAWAAGDDTDPAGRPLLRHHRWQAHLWRLVRADIAVPSPAERLPGLIDALRAGELDVDLPDRVLLFGLTLLPGGAGFLDLADALAVITRRAPVPARAVARVGSTRRRAARAGARAGQAASRRPDRRVGRAPAGRGRGDVCTARRPCCWPTPRPVACRPRATSTSRPGDVGVRR